MGLILVMIRKGSIGHGGLALIFSRYFHTSRSHQRVHGLRLICAGTFSDCVVRPATRMSTIWLEICFDIVDEDVFSLQE